MATFQAGAIPSSFGNVLYNPMAVDQAVQAGQRNSLMMAGEQQRQAVTSQAMAEHEQQQIGQAAAWVAGLPQDQQEDAYNGAVKQLRANGMARNAPPYPGAQALRGIAQRTLPVEKQYELGLITSPELAAALKGAFGQGGTPGGGASAAPNGGAAPVSMGTQAVPAELMPHFQEASARTGIPVPTLVAQAQQESSMGKASPNIMQVTDSTARDPGFGMTGVDPATLRDPRANINFGADYLKARSGGGDMTDPAVRDAALKAYNGGGDPNYVQNVGRYLPGGGAAARTGGVDVAGPGAPGGGAPAAAAPAAPMPTAQAGQPAPAAPATGINSPQYQQATDKLRQAAQIEAMPGAAMNPQAKAAVAYLRQQAQMLLQADSVVKGPGGVQVDTMTGKEDDAAKPLANWVYDPNTGTWLDTAAGGRPEPMPAGRVGRDAFGNSFVTLPGGRTQAIPAQGDRPLSGNYDQQAAAYKANIPVQKDIATAGRAAQASALQLNELADVIKGLKTGGIAPEFRAKAAAFLESSGAQPETIKSLTGMSSGSDAQVMQKLAVATLGQAAKTDLGSNVGVESLNLYAQANPGMNLLPDANKRVTNMIRVARAQVDDYSGGAEQHFNTNQSSFLHQGHYNEPLSVYNQKWLTQNNPQIGAAAMGILNGDKYDTWAARAQPADAIAATRLAAKIDPTIKVPMPDGSFQPAHELLARAGGGG